MTTLNYTTSKSAEDLEGILDLQRNNVTDKLTPEEVASQGFVTVVHSFSDLQKMSEIEPHIICKVEEKVIAYLLAMTPDFKNYIPILIPMFEVFSKLIYSGKPVSTYNYIVVGQVCVDKNFRGQGVLDNCYEAYKNIFKGKYDFAITEIASRNLRSINAHKRIGFSEICTYCASDGEEWKIVIWEW